MPFYYVNHRTPEGIWPPIAGEEFADMDAVREECLVGAKQMIADRLASGAPLGQFLDQSFEVTDNGGIVVLRVPFSDAMEADTRIRPSTII